MYRLKFPSSLLGMKSTVSCFGVHAKHFSNIQFIPTTATTAKDIAFIDTSNVNTIEDAKLTCFGSKHFSKLTAANPSCFGSSHFRESFSGAGTTRISTEDQTPPVCVVNYLNTFPDVGIKEQKELWDWCIDNDADKILERLATEDRDLVTGINYMEKVLQGFMEKYPEAEGRVFWDMYPEKLQYLKVLRLQTNNGTCTIQAAILLLHYMLTIHSEVPHNVGVFDVSSFIRHLVKCNLQDLKFYLSRTFPGFIPEIVLSQLFETRGVRNAMSTFALNAHGSSKRAMQDEILERLQSKPAFLGKFMVMKDFQDEQAVMWVMVQNFWQHKVFIKMSYDYLCAAGAILEFVDIPVVKLPVLDGVITSYSMASETCADKGCDGEEPMI